MARWNYITPGVWTPAIGWCYAHQKPAAYGADQRRWARIWGWQSQISLTFAMAVDTILPKEGVMAEDKITVFYDYT